MLIRLFTVTIIKIVTSNNEFKSIEIIMRLVSGQAMSHIHKFCSDDLLCVCTNFGIVCKCHCRIKEMW